MPYKRTIRRIRKQLITTFDCIDTYFDLEPELRQFHRGEDEWSMDEILEHITLTNHYLMITLKQSLTKVLRRAKELPIPDNESQLDKIIQISDPDAFVWIRPEHMEPTRNISSHDVRQKMKQQKEDCLEILRQIQNGEGSLHRVRMSVQNLGKLDMYEWLYFLIQHAKRHGIEMARIVVMYHEKARST